jgi:predicted nucleic acid-binding Zn ribbon protein
MRRTNNNQSVEALFETILKQNGIWQKFLEQKIVNNWKTIVGTKIAKSTTKIEIVGGKLYLSVDSSVLRNELLMLKSNIIDLVNSKAGENIIDDVVIR